MPASTAGARHGEKHAAPLAQTSAIYALGLPAVVITHGASQTADYSGDDSNVPVQVAQPKTLAK